MNRAQLDDDLFDIFTPMKQQRALAMPVAKKMFAIVETLPRSGQSLAFALALEMWLEKIQKIDAAEKRRAKARKK